MALGVIIVLSTIVLLVAFQAFGALVVRWMDSRTPSAAPPPPPPPKRAAAGLCDIERAKAKRAIRVQIRHPKHGPSTGDRHA